jgi:lysophospholipase L1-like esterase
MVGRLLKRGVAAGAVVVGAEVAYAVLRPVPRLEEFDPSGSFGDPNLPELRVAVLGDSSVTAPGVSGPDEIWVSLVCDRLTDRYHVVMRSFAVSGSRASDLLRDQLDPALAFDPNLILVAVGANDVIKGLSHRSFEQNLDELIEGLSETDAVIVMSGVGDLGTIPRLLPPLRNMMTRRSAAFDRIHRDVAARHGAHVVDQRSDEPQLWYRDPGLWSADLFHVSAAGHQRWANVVWRAIEPLLAAGHERV